MSSTRTRSLTAVLLAASLVMTLPSPAQAKRSRRCADRTNRVYATAKRFGVPGVYSLPRRKPRTMMVFAHGYKKPASVYWRHHLRSVASRGILGVAMDYRGIGPAPDYRGWNVRAGAADSIRAARHFLRTCRSLRTVVMVGVSMGGNTAGLAVAAEPKRRDGRPLFDYLVQAEPAANVTETYMEARALAPANAYAKGAVEDIEKEMGGTFEQVPDRYREATLVARAGDIARAVKGVVLIHALEDGLVPYNQSREFWAALKAHGVPTDFYTVGTRGDGEAGTTLTGYVPTGQQSPFAGHASEESTTHIVMRSTFERLWALHKGERPGPQREFVVDGAAGQLP